MIRDRFREQFARIFSNWLADNKHRFNYQPTRIRYRKGILTFNFKNISDTIKCTISKTMGTLVSVNYKGDYWDSLISLELSEIRIGNKYRCNLCENSEEFDTREALWINHEFEPLLEWCNTEFLSNKFVRLNKSENGVSTWASIGDSDCNAFVQYPLIEST